MGDWLQDRCNEIQKAQQEHIQKSLGTDIEKARAGVYKPTKQNLKEGIAGQKYGTEKKEDDKGITKNIKDFAKKFGTSLKIEKYGSSDKIVMNFNKDDQGIRSKIQQVLHTDNELNKQLSTIDSVEGKVVFHINK